MFWKKEVPEAKKDKLNRIEEFILQAIGSELSPELKAKLERQVRYLPLMKRITYRNETTGELYPEQFGAMPEEILFPRKEEFKLASLNIFINETSAKCEVFMVLGALFEIKIKAVLSPQMKSAGQLMVKSMIVETILDKNIY